MMAKIGSYSLFSLPHIHVHVYIHRETIKSLEQCQVSIDKQQWTAGWVNYTSADASTYSVNQSNRRLLPWQQEAGKTRVETAIWSAERISGLQIQCQISRSAFPTRLICIQDSRLICFGSLATGRLCPLR